MPDLFPQDFFYFSDLCLDFTGQFFAFTLGFQLRIVAEYPGGLLEPTFGFMQISGHLVFGVVFHDSLFLLSRSWGRVLKPKAQISRGGEAVQLDILTAV